MNPIVATAMAVLGMVTLVAAAPPESEGTIAIAFVNPHAPQRIDAAARALMYDVNAERVKRNLPTLTPDDTLDRLAYAKAYEMAQRGYFGHTNPDGVTFEQRLRASHWDSSAAENIAFDRSERAAHAAFMNSPPHRANVLDASLRRIGTAVVTVATGETFYVEDFGGPSATATQVELTQR